MITFSNTTPIIALSSINRLQLLPQLFGQIYLVHEVIEECAVGGRIFVPSLLEFDWIKPVQSTAISHSSILLELDKGEKHTLDMACKHKAVMWCYDSGRFESLGINAFLTVYFVIGAIK